MKILVIIIAAATIAVIASVSFFSQIHYDNKIPCTFCPEGRAPNQSLQILDITTEPAIVSIGNSFLIYADVSNPNPYSIYLNGGCASQYLQLLIKMWKQKKESHVLQCQMKK